MTWRPARSSVVSVVWGVVDFQLVLASEAVKEAGHILVSSALAQSWRSYIFPLSRHAVPFSAGSSLLQAWLL